VCHHAALDIRGTTRHRRQLAQSRQDILFSCLTRTERAIYCTYVSLPPSLAHDSFIVPMSIQNGVQSRPFGTEFSHKHAEKTNCVPEVVMSQIAIAGVKKALILQPQEFRQWQQPSVQGNRTGQKSRRCRLSPVRMSSHLE
jgi:hypothetical protein